jgi:predicted phage terminase large subunit-like protein
MTILQQSPESNISQAQAALELLRRREARRGLLAFTQYTMPDYETNWHHEVLCAQLDRLVSGEIKRLMVFMPPRHGKSELVSRRLPAYILGVNPDTSIIGCSYGADLASMMNRDIQRIIDDQRYSRVFPETSLFGKNIRTLSQGNYLRNSDVFEVVGRQGVYRSAGVGGGITGMGFHFGIIDDPIKDPKDAESEVVRESLWEWYTGAFWKRQAAGARILLTMTRWHEDDLAGRLLSLAKLDPKADQWEVLKLPGICEDVSLPHEVRPLGEALWPNRFNLEYFQASKANNARQHEAMDQQNPTAREGNMFKVGKLGFVDAAPSEGEHVRFWDKGATDGGGDFTAGVKLSKGPEGAFYVEDVKRGQWATDERDAHIKQTAEIDGRGVAVGGEQEPGSSGKDAALAFVRLLAGFRVTTSPASGTKEVRADPFSSQVNAGNVKLVRGSWNAAFIEELRQFPQGKHDDQVDAASGAFNKLFHNRRLLVA